MANEYSKQLLVSTSLCALLSRVASDLSLSQVLFNKIFAVFAHSACEKKTSVWWLYISRKERRRRTQAITFYNSLRSLRPLRAETKHLCGGYYYLTQRAQRTQRFSIALNTDVRVVVSFTTTPYLTPPCQCWMYAYVSDAARNVPTAWCFRSPLTVKRFSFLVNRSSFTAPSPSVPGCGSHW